jgi:hypothetical protein
VALRQLATGDERREAYALVGAEQREGEELLGEVIEKRRPSP